MPAQRIGVLALELLEVLEVVGVEQLAGLAVVHLHHDVVLEAGLLDQHLAVVGAAVERRDVLLGAVAGVVLDVEVEAAGEHEVGAGRARRGAPEVGVASRACRDRRSGSRCGPARRTLRSVSRRSSLVR